MTRAKTTTSSKKRPALSPGLHAGKIELRSARDYLVRLPDGTRVSAVLDDDVAPELAMECLRTSRTVIVTQGHRGPTILGSLQTSAGLVRDEDGKVRLSARDLVIAAERTLAIEAGPVSLRVDRAGDLKLEGERMIIDMAALVRFLSARVELP